MTHFLLSSPRDKKSGWRYLGNKEGFWWWAGIKTTRFFKAFDIVKKGDFCILEFRISGSGGLSREQEELLEIRWWQNDLIFERFSSITYKHTWIFGLWIWGILDFWISGSGGDISEKSYRRSVACISGAERLKGEGWSQGARRASNYIKPPEFYRKITFDEA